MKCTNDAWYMRINQCNVIAWLFGAMLIKEDNSGCFDILKKVKMFFTKNHTAHFNENHYAS